MDIIIPPASYNRSYTVMQYAPLAKDGDDLFVEFSDDRSSYAKCVVEVFPKGRKSIHLLHNDEWYSSNVVEDTREFKYSWWMANVTDDKIVASDGSVLRIWVKGINIRELIT